MNIALFPSAFHPSLGGVEELTRQLAHEYRRLGHRVILVTNRWPRTLPRFEMFEGLPLHRIAMRVPEGTFRMRFNYELTHRLIYRHLISTLRHFQTDVLHIQCVSSNGLYALHAKRALGVPLVTTLQGELTMDANRLYQTSQFAQRLLRDVMDASDMVTGCSAKTLADGEEFYQKHLGTRGRVVFNGARIEDFASGSPYSHGKPYILAIGRVVPQKGFDVLLRAYAQAQTAGHDLVIAGDGTELAALQALAGELGLTGRVHFLGRADRAKTVSLFQGASFFVLPSRADEGLPVVCAEALAAGLPIVATRSGGAPEAVHQDVHGLIVDKDSVPQLTAAISRMATEPDMRSRFAQAARSGARPFAWSTIAGQYVDIYRQVRQTSSARVSA